MTTITADGIQAVVTRRYAAPVERIYRAWTDAAQMTRWFRPNERWNDTHATLDVREGGEYEITMRHSDGDEIPFRGRYLEVVPNERLVFTWTVVADPRGLHETEVKVELRPTEDGGTELTLTHTRLRDETDREQVTGGWTGILQTLGESL